MIQHSGVYTCSFLYSNIEQVSYLTNVPTIPPDMDDNSVVTAVLSINKIAHINKTGFWGDIVNK